MDLHGDVKIPSILMDCNISSILMNTLQTYLNTVYEAMDNETKQKSYFEPFVWGRFMYSMMSTSKLEMSKMLSYKIDISWKRGMMLF